MRESDILVQFFKDNLGEKYDVSAFRNAITENPPAKEVLRVIQSTEEIIAKSLTSDKTRAVLRTSQSDYVGINGITAASFTWSLEFAAKTDDSQIDDDMDEIRKNFTEKIIPVIYKDENYELLLTFTIPAKFAATLINGVKYQQVVWGGRATITDNSVLSNGYTFYIDGEKIPGVISVSNGYTSQGESFNSERVEYQQTAIQSFTNAVGLSVHASKNNAVVAKMLAASMQGDAEGFAFTVRQNGEIISEWDYAVFNQVGSTGSLGSYMLLDVQILRS